MAISATMSLECEAGLHDLTELDQLIAIQREEIVHRY